ncbi:ABC transporter substrate-binding protein [Rathayibacter sp. VKM Ac-2857]|uniref:ABC transporter substrate-binding protein n=1 Tax=Rathayibacter sp. VKM Ac-2857 TaxID=2739020 RepID=UPI001565CC9F|nr:ABC transporter substrate-binding protein [Rathayibacter sp. VKM Ac-2857]NQX16884.1 ABC transporter substrate-binding protein [Rathayibacter sp. VKM Ac-2857]
MTRSPRTTALRVPAVAAGSLVALLALSACSAPAGGSAAGADPVSGGTFSLAVNDDPGSLNPFTGVSLVQRAMVTFGYDSLAYTTPEGEVVPFLAESWESTPTSISYTLKDGITCADGTPFTAETAAANFAYQANADNGTFWFGSSVTADMTATAEGNVVTVTSTANNPFLLQGTGSIEMVCQAGLDDPSTLTDTTNGTALYALTASNPGSDYTYTKRDGYTWGPDDVTSDTEGLPDEIEARVITDEATAANLLISGELNAASVIGADRQRLDAAGLDTEGVLNPIGEMLFNERADRPTADVRVRQALTLSLDRDAVGELVTDGNALESVSLVNQIPLTCVAGGPEWTLPDTDIEAAGKLLDEAGYPLGSDGLRAKDGEPLTIRFLYDAGTPSHGAAAEEVQQEWNELGITTDLVSEDSAGWSTDLYQSYDWDTGFIQLAPSSPVVLSLFFLGETSENGGYNFMGVSNPEYNALATQALSAGTADEACGIWKQAEAELIERVDVFPLAETESPMYVKGATLERPGTVAPTTIRMQG